MAVGLGLCPMPEPLSPVLMTLSPSPSPPRDVHGKDARICACEDDLTDAPTEPRSPLFASDTESADSAVSPLFASDIDDGRDIASSCHCLSPLSQAAAAAAADKEQLCGEVIPMLKGRHNKKALDGMQLGADKNEENKKALDGMQPGADRNETHILPQI